MSEIPKDLSSGERARWLGELSEALDEADRLASRVALECMPGGDAVELVMRLAAARAQLQSLRLARPKDGSEDPGPEWISPALWSGEPADMP